MNHAKRCAAFFAAVALMLALGAALGGCKHSGGDDDTLTNYFLWKYIQDGGRTAVVYQTTTGTLYTMSIWTDCTWDVVLTVADTNVEYCSGTWKCAPYSSKIISLECTSICDALKSQNWEPSDFSEPYPVDLTEDRFIWHIMKFTQTIQLEKK